MTTESIIQNLIRSGKLSRNRLQGCTPTELDSLQSHFGQKLPDEYRSFMELGGRGIGQLFIGTDIYFPRVLDLQAEALELLSDHSLHSLLPNNSMVFCIHQGYEVNYLLPHGPNPPVYQYIEGERQSVLGCKSFTDFLEEAIHAHLSEVGSCD